MSDKQTLAVYAAQARDYADMVTGEDINRPLQAFLNGLPPGGRVLDWGCGAGNASAVMIEQGFDVTATDASTTFAGVAKESYGVDVRVETFADLNEQAEYDGIWASFSLLHAPKSEMPSNLARAYRALKPGGRLYLGLKTGEGEQRDDIGRFYAYYTDEEITALLTAAAGFTITQRETGADKGLDGKMWPFILIYAHA